MESSLEEVEGEAGNQAEGQQEQQAGGGHLPLSSAAISSACWGEEAVRDSRLSDQGLHGVVGWDKAGGAP